MAGDPGDITQLLQLVRAGESGAEGRLADIVYRELHLIAMKRMRSEASGHTLSPTALVHEFWLRVGAGSANHAENRGHFFAVASTAMRRILVDHARSRKAEKRGGGTAHLDLSNVDLGNEGTLALIVAVDEALQQLARAKPRVAQVVEMRFFVGLTLEEIAEALGVDRRTIVRDWTIARAWLFSQLGTGTEAGIGTGKFDDEAN